MAKISYEKYEHLVNFIFHLSMGMDGLVLKEYLDYFLTEDEFEEVLILNRPFLGLKMDNDAFFNFAIKSLDSYYIEEMRDKKLNEILDQGNISN